MAGQVICNMCGGRIAIPAGHVRPKIRCTTCGYYAEVPPESRANVPVDDEPNISFEDDPPVRAAKNSKDVNESGDRTPIPPKKVKKAKTQDPGPQLLQGTQDEDDDKPYAVPGDGTKKCEKCGKGLPLDAILCVYCGEDLVQRKKKKKRKFTEVDERWESTASMSTRIKGFLAIQFVNALMLINVILTGGSVVALTTVMFNVLMQAFLLGSYDTLFVKRTAKGAATLTKQWRLAFIPLAPTEIKWKQSSGVGIFGLHDPGVVEYILLVLLLSMGTGQIFGWIINSGNPIMMPFVIILSAAPAFAWYWFVIRPERHMITLCDEYGSTNDTIFRTTSRDTAEEIMQVISDSTGLTPKSSV